MSGVYLAFGNVMLIVSNLPFLMPMKSCLTAKKYLCAIIYLGICIVSSLYHLCKWGPVDGFGYGGYCIDGLSFQEYFVFDFFFSQMTIPACASFFINPKKAAVEVGEFIHSKDRKMRKGFYTQSDGTTINAEYSATNGRPNGDTRDNLTMQASSCTNSDYLLFKYVNSTNYVKGVFGNYHRVEDASQESDFHETNYSVSSKFTHYDHCGEEFDAIEVKCSHCDSNIVIHKKNVAIMDNILYYKISSWKRTALANLENFYLVFHVLAISTAIKVVGTSITYITLPLVIFNISFVLVILMQSYSVENYNKPMEAVNYNHFANPYGVYVGRNFNSPDEIPLDIGTRGPFDNLDECIDISHSMSPHIIGDDGDDYTISGKSNSRPEAPKNGIRELDPFCKSFMCFNHLNKLIGICGRALKACARRSGMTTSLGVGAPCCGGGGVGGEKFERSCERRYGSKKLKIYEHLLGFNLIRSVQWSLSVNSDYCCYELTKNKLISTALSLAFAIIAVVLFSSQHYIPTTVYWFTHSTWHILGASGQYIIFSMVL